MSPSRFPSSASEAPPVGRRRILFVSMPFGPFGRLLLQALRRRGVEVRHMAFSAGDLVSARGSGAIVYQGRAADWPRRLDDLAGEFTDIVVFGESGPYNRAVLDRPRGDGAPRVWVLENGYFRPDWITLERDGANAASRLPRMAAAYAARPPRLPRATPTGPALRSLVFHLSVYYLAEFLLFFLFPGHRAGFTVPPWRQCAGHIVRFARQRLARPDRREAALLARGAPFFLVCLQRDGDSQLLNHSDIHDNQGFLDRVIASFARAAPAGTRLVVKLHPLDPGVVDMEAATAATARRHGVGDRVDVIDGGRLATLCRASRGMVVNNSSAALSALGFGTPVKALGRAIFDFDGLTDPQPLDGFWSRPCAPDAALFRRFRGHVMARTQINGSFDAPSARVDTADAVADILSGRPPSWRPASAETGA